ncbi:EKC/KEOPS complex subunit GON7 isoform X2 [Canis lupus dingo]|uniref:EKC/KEOPS complex subunit GON7 isoform X2 n=1 Tax=Canis lupus dingo TaxID=286419 RepID=UPI0015F17A97|nr:EKC/KEOPS complex subunit GON7 isoform X2 [Canis lupus dingo]
MELLGEYVGLDGQQRLLRVPCEAPADADPFQGLLSGVAQMRELVAELFDPLVQQEAQDREAAAAEEAMDVSYICDQYRRNALPGFLICCLLRVQT